MDRWKQYASMAAVFSAFLTVGYWGFTATGGAVPWAKRASQALQRGVQESGGSLVNLGRGIVVAGPIRKGGLMLEFGGIVFAFVLFGLGLYIYVDRYDGFESNDRPTR